MLRLTQFLSDDDTFLNIAILLLYLLIIVFIYRKQILTDLKKIFAAHFQETITAVKKPEYRHSSPITFDLTGYSTDAPDFFHPRRIKQVEKLR